MAPRELPPGALHHVRSPAGRCVLALALVIYAGHGLETSQLFGQLAASPLRRLAFATAADSNNVFTDRPASVAADWCPRLYGWLVTPPFMGVHVFTNRLAFATAADSNNVFTDRPASVAADWCPRLYGWLVTPPFMGVHVFTNRLAFAAADWCLCRHG
uniref:HGWP repeat containing protein-like n=1 Tax=Oryza sativa subsp. japonica TaxID=39947 RepID=Q2QTF2_ORYSJ|nr:hypothetical protein LOC_Os12g19850 [Oryza sativa Japonica Group]